ncbi:MAG: signal recognition particle-docking protein FtsY, partial [Eubacteriales bacterium]|nr:signal recognition particle-docking protein FtsY [Eubacteriales bacterium]
MAFDLLQKLKQGLSRTGSALQSVFSGAERIDDAFYDELEEALILADAGMDTAEAILDELKERIEADKLKERSEARLALKDVLAERMQPNTPFLSEAAQAVILIVGVNGVGKTTSIGKLAAFYTAEGKKVMLAAADTFRAAAAEQLSVWAARAGVPIVKHGEGADPAAVVFDACASCKAKHCDMLLCDTAGRLHNKKNLMNELEKMRRVIDKEMPQARVEALLVIDATTGQNAIAQAKAFSEATGLTGVILTKLDGTAKGGVALAVRDALGIPVRFVGVGEGIDDLQP